MRKTARILLKNKWLKASLVTATALAAAAVSFLVQILFLPQRAALICSVVFSALAIKPIFLGHKRWCAYLRPDKKARYRDLFYFFTTPKRYFKGVFTGLTVFLRVLFTALVTSIPTTSCFMLAGWLKTQPENEMTRIFINNCIILGLVAVPVFAAIFIILTARNAAVAYIVAEDDSVRIRDAVKRSSRLVRERWADILKTFFPITILIPLCVFIIPIFIIIPYCTTVFSQYVKIAAAE